MTTAETLVKRLKHLTAIKGGAGFPHEEQDLVDEELAFFKVASLDGASAEGILSNPDHRISRETAKRLGAHIFRPETVVFAKVGVALLLNRFRQLGAEACIDNNMMGLEPLGTEVLPRFLLYAMQAKDLSLIVNPGAVPSINGSQIAEERIWCPSPVEQEHIANFLDDKTARIDALIAEKERLMGAILEHEQAQISVLLTMGSGNAPLVSTGREFIPQAPAPWRMVAFKRAMKGMSQGWSPQCDSRPAEPGEWGVLKVGCVNGTTFDATENKALPSTLEPDVSCVLHKGDVLVSRANTRELVGMAALVEDDHPNLMLCDKLYRLDLRSDWVLPEFAVLTLRSDVSRRQIELGASGASSSMQNISQDVIRELLVALPPISEQLDIVARARDIRQKCGSLVRHIAAHIDRLREYRSSLISAAVTGQLDISTYGTAT